MICSLDRRHRAAPNLTTSITNARPEGDRTTTERPKVLGYLRNAPVELPMAPHELGVWEENRTPDLRITTGCPGPCLVPSGDSSMIVTRSTRVAPVYSSLHRIVCLKDKLESHPTPTPPLPQRCGTDQEHREAPHEETRRRPGGTRPPPRAAARWALRRDGRRGSTCTSFMARTSKMGTRRAEEPVPAGDA